MFPKKIWEVIEAQACAEYPKECCGFVLGFSQSQDFSRVFPCRNAQDEFHNREPKNFPRTSSTAYFMDPKDLLRLQKETRNNKEKIKVIYHSHIDAPAEFSAEDQRMAMSDGEPIYPETVYLVLSVVGGEIKDRRFYRWESQSKSFLELIPHG